MAQGNTPTLRSLAQGPIRVSIHVGIKRSHDYQAIDVSETVEFDVSVEDLPALRGVINSTRAGMGKNLREAAQDQLQALFGEGL